MPSSFFTLQAEEEDEQQQHSTRHIATHTSTVLPSEHTLDKAPIQLGRLHEFNARGRTLKNAFHPLLLQGQAWISEKHVNARIQSSFIV
jgi:hypothetical protein